MMEVRYRPMSTQQMVSNARRNKGGFFVPLVLWLILSMLGCSGGGGEDSNVSLIESYMKKDFEIGVQWGGKDVTENAKLEDMGKIMGEMKGFLTARGLEKYIDNRQFKRRSVYALKNGVTDLKIDKTEVKRKENDTSEDKPSYTCTLFYTGKGSDGTTKVFREEREILMEKTGQSFKIKTDTLLSTKQEP